MKLITEYTNSDISYLTEATANGDRKIFIEGIFMQADKPNRNGRLYPGTVLRSAVDKYINEQVKMGRAVGELNHPNGPAINLDKVSHRITELSWEGSNVMGKALILNTPMGKVVKGLVEGGVKLGVSSRGMGSLEKRENVMHVKNDFILNTIDIVQDPSAPEAFVNGIMEGVEYIWENGIVVSKQIEEYETEIKNTPMKDLRKTEMDIFADFLSKMNKR